MRRVDLKAVGVEAVLEWLKIEVLKRADNELYSLCPHPEHKDKEPSWHIRDKLGDRKHGVFHCWSCLEEIEEVWTAKGLIDINDLSKGDLVFRLDGTWGIVERKQSSRKVCVFLDLALVRKDGLGITPDHVCMVVRRQDAFDSLPYLWQGLARPKGRFFGIAKKRKRIRRYAEIKVPISEVSVSELREGDYMLFPVLDRRPGHNMQVGNLSGAFVIKPYTSGPRVRRIDYLPCTEEVMCLCGLYLAEGSTYRGVVEWTFHENERETLAAKVLQILRGSFDLEASIVHRPEKHVVKVRCCNTDLVALLKYYFGSLAWGKHLPPGCFDWPPRIQKSLIESWADGDGNSEGFRQVVTTSRKLAHGMFGLSIQAGLIPSVLRKDAYIDSDGGKHRESWIVSWRKRESLDGFFEDIEGVHYLWLKIAGIRKESNKKKTVCDIEVWSPESTSQSHTFVSRIGAVHNCKWSGNVISLVAVVRGISLGAAAKLVQAFVGARPEGLPATEADLLRGMDEYEPPELEGFVWKNERILTRSITPASRAGAYLFHRMIGPAYIAQCGLLDWPEFRRIIVPIYLHGRLISWVARTYNDGKPKTLAPHDAPKKWELIGIDEIDPDIPEANLVEGWSDRIRLMQIEKPNPLALCGSRITEYQAEMLLWAKRVIVWMDGDKAGEVLGDDTVSWFGAGREIFVVPFPSGTDPAKFSPLQLLPFQPIPWEEYRRKYHGKK